MRLRQCILTENDCYKAGRPMTPKGVMVHSTGANNTYIKRYVQPDDGVLGVNRYKNDWNRPGTGKCVHAFIGRVEDGSIATYQTLPWDMRGWHAGGAANKTHISFEICEDALTSETYFNAVYKEAAEFTAYLCGLYGLDPMKDGVVICHKEGWRRGIASNHGDVENWFPKFDRPMDVFRRDVAELMRGGEDMTREQILEKLGDRYIGRFEELPEWAKPDMRELLDRGVIVGARAEDSDDINMLLSDIRTIIVAKRMLQM